MYGASKRCKKWGRKHNWIKVTKFVFKAWLLLKIQLCFQVAIRTSMYILRASQGGMVFRLMVKNQPANAGDAEDTVMILESGRPQGGGNGYPLQYSCPENPTDRGTWRATVHGVTKSWRQLKQLGILKGRAKHQTARSPASLIQFYQLQAHS